MKITEIIEQLEALKEKHGDLPVFVSPRELVADYLNDWKIWGVIYDDKCVSPDAVSIFTKGALICLG